jgi:hypothetical protein
MKKIIKNQLAFLIMLIVVMVYSSITTKTFGQIVIKTLGSAVNAFTQVGINRTKVSYAPGINTVLFIHRGDPAVAGSSGNKAMYDISTNGGATWSNMGPVIDLSPAAPHVRYPQGYIMNPASNTNLTNARIVAAAPKATGVNNGWGRITSGMVTLAATGKKESLVSDSALIPNSFVERIPGEYWMVSDTNTDGKITLYKGVYSLAGDSVAWTVALKLAKSRTLFDRSIDGNVHYVNPMVAFSPNGQFGWIATNGEIAGGVVDSSLYPIFWSTTNGGQTWTGPQVVRLKNLSNVVASVNSTKPTATIDNDLVVDKNGIPHFAFVVAPKTTAYSYNVHSAFKSPIFDITRVNNVWTAVRVDTVSSLNGASFGTLTHENEIQLSRTKDGGKIFYSWTDTKNPIAGLNSSPNLYIKGYNVDSSYFGPKISPTSGSSINNLVFLPNTSDIVSDSTSSGYKLHTVIATPTGDENVTVGFSYLDNLYYKFNNSSPNANPTNFSLALDGINDFGSIANAFFTNINQRDFTIEFYMKPDANQSQYPGIWGKTGYWSEMNVHLYQPGKIALMYATTVGGNQYFNSDTVSLQYNHWDHYAIVGEANTNQLRIYKNGVLDATTSHGTPIWSIPNNDSKLGAVFQGWTSPNTQYFKGKLDDFRVSDIARYSSNFTPPQNILSDINTRVLYNFNSINYNIVPDLSGNNNNLTLQNGASLDTDAPYTINPSLPNNVPTNGLLAYYPFNGNANDASGNGYNGVVTGALLTKGVGNNLNGAYKFKNNNDIIVTNLSNSNLQSLTISSWFKYKNPISFPLPTLLDSTWHSICGFSDNNNNVSDLIAASDYGASSNSSNIRLSGYTYNGNRNWVNTNVNQLDTNWHHIVYVRGVYSLLIYLDGVLQNTNAYNGSYQYLTNFVIGRYYKIWNQGAFKGSIDEVGIWTRALTQSEITALYNTPTVAASDSLWVINKQTDTLAFPSQVKLSLKSNNITSKNISAYDIKLNYDASKLKFDSVNKTNTASANGSVIVNSATTGQVIIGWASSSSISSATLPLLNLFFTPIDSGKTTVSIANAIFNTDTVKNRYSKLVINKFNFGDVDMNKIIQSYDASVVLKYSIGIDPLPTIDPLPWEPWRIKIASVDTTIAVNANDASLILKYSVGIITKFPKRGITSAPGYVTVNLENNELVVRSFEDMGGLNITFLDHLSDLGAPTYVHNTNALSAFNKQTNMYKIGVAFSEAPVNGTIILRIPYTGLGNQTLNMELVENTAARNYQLNVVTGINDIKNSNIKIYPNPTNNIINIEGLNKNENNTIQIFDVQGKLVITKTINEKGAIDLSELNKGVYVIKIGEVAQRIVKM